MGTENLKVLLDGGLTVGELLFQFTDGIGFDDLGKLIEAGRKIGPAIKDAKAAFEEYKGMTDVEALEVETFVAQSFDIADDKIEQTIETVLKFAIELHGLIGIFQSKQPAVVPVKG